MSKPLSFKIKVTSCQDCLYAKFREDESFLYASESYCDYFACHKDKFKTFDENFEDLTPSCPAWQAQKKEILK